VGTERRTIIVSLLLAVSLSEGRSLPLPLLFTTIQPIVNIDSYSDVLIERIRAILLIELVLNLLLKSIVEQVYKPFLVDLGP
jgi:hypothetical protein